MCKWGTTTDLLVPIPAEDSHTGEARWDTKPIDSCIADIVQALNAGGMLTRMSCCGHGNGPACIDLQDGRVLRAFGGEILPWESKPLERTADSTPDRDRVHVVIGGEEYAITRKEALGIIDRIRDALNGVQIEGAA